MSVKTCIPLMVVLAIVACQRQSESDTSGAAASEDGVRVYFSPQTDCRMLVIQHIRQAEKQVSVQAYSFSSERIAKALVEAHRRGVKVMVIIDSEKADKKSETHFLSKRGISTFSDAAHVKAHNKVVLIDGKTIITGSFNFTDADDEATADNLLVIEGKTKLMDAYQRNFDVHLAHSVKQ